MSTKRGKALSDKLVIEFNPETFADILLATHLCTVEISGLAKVVRDEGRNFKVFGDALIFNQECSAGGTEPDVEAYNLWTNEMISSGDENKIKEVTDQKLWWHSHVWYEVIFSGTDLATMKRILSGFSQWWLVLVVNKKNKHCLALIEKNGGYLRYEEAPLILVPEITEKQFRELVQSRREIIQKTIDEKVKIVER